MIKKNVKYNVKIQIKLFNTIKIYMYINILENLIYIYKIIYFERVKNNPFQFKYFFQCLNKQ